MHAPIDMSVVVRRVRRDGRPVLRLDGTLLALAGLLALIADLAGAFLGRGPFMALFGQPLAIAAAEAHGLALLLGLLLVRAAGRPDHWFWHVVALAVHTFLAACNLLFWDSYIVQEIVAAGVITTLLHVLLAGLQLVCLARASADEQGALPSWLAVARRSALYVREVAIVTLALGAALHMAVVIWGRDVLPRLVTPPVELVLTVAIAYVSLAGWLAWPSLVFRGRWQRVLLAAILVYFPIGLPLHVRTLVTGSAAHYDVVPAWYSLLIAPLMIGMLVIFARLGTGRPGAHMSE
jgi:hypothetical protein